MRLSKLLPFLLLAFASPAVAQSGCGGQFSAGQYCGSQAGGLPGPTLVPAGGTTPIAGGTVLGNPTTSSALPIATKDPVLGIPGASVGSLSFGNATSGTVKLQPTTGALGSSVASLPVGTYNLAGLSLVQTWTAAQSFNDSTFLLNGSTSGTLTLRAAATSGSSVIRFPNGSTDFSATGGTSQVIKQASVGAALTVGQLAFSDISGTATAAQMPAGVDTNAGRAVTSAPTISSSDCGKPIFAGGATFYALTLGAASGFTANCTIILVNTDPWPTGTNCSTLTGGRGKSVAVSGLSGALPILWPGMTVKFRSNSTATAWLQDPVYQRVLVPVSQKFCIDNVNGSNSNDCLAAGSGNACQAIDGLYIGYAYKYFSIANGSSTPNNPGLDIRLATNPSCVPATGSGCYAGAHLSGAIPGNEGNNAVQIECDGGSATNCTISDAGGANCAIGAFNSAINLELKNVTLAGGGGNCGIEASNNSTIRILSGVVLGPAGSSAAQLQADMGGQIVLDGGNTLTISGGGAWLGIASANSRILLDGGTISFSTSVSYGQQVLTCTSQGLVSVQGVTWSLNANTVTGTRFFASGNCAILTGTANPNVTIPGSVNGSVGLTAIADGLIGGVGTVTGALKGDGVGNVSQAACANLSDGAASCSTNTTNAANISSGTLPAGRLPALTGDCTTTVGTVATTCTKIQGNAPGQMVINVAGVNFNSANTDTTITIPVTTNSAFTFNQVIVYNCTAALGTATFAVFPSAAGAGTSLTSNPVSTVGTITTQGPGTAASVLAAGSTVATTWFNQTSIFFRVIAAQGSAVTCSISIRINLL